LYSTLTILGTRLPPYLKKQVTVAVMVETISIRPPIKKHHKQVRKAPTKGTLTVKPVLLRLIYRKTGIIATYLP
jgi:hypothetical protein